MPPWGDVYKRQILSRPAAAALRNYTRQRKEGKNPVFRAADIGLKEKTDYWN